MGDWLDGARRIWTLLAVWMNGWVEEWKDGLMNGKVDERGRLLNMIA